MQGRDQIIDGLKAVHRQMAGQLDKIENTLERNKDHPESVGQALHQQITEMRELVQLLVYKTEMLNNSEGGHEEAG